MKTYLSLLVYLAMLFPVAATFADDREVTEEQQAAISGANDAIPEAKPKRPRNLPDLKKGEPARKAKPGRRPGAGALPESSAP